MSVSETILITGSDVTRLVNQAGIHEFMDVLINRMQAAFADQKIDLQDGVRVDWEDKWVHVRPSNTEPIIRVIAEASDEAQAKELVQRVRDVLGLA